MACLRAIRVVQPQPRRRRTATDVMGKQAGTCTTNVLRWWWFRSSQSVGIYNIHIYKNGEMQNDVRYILRDDAH